MRIKRTSGYESGCIKLDLLNMFNLGLLLRVQNRWGIPQFRPNKGLIYLCLKLGMISSCVYWNQVSAKLCPWYYRYECYTWGYHLLLRPNMDDALQFLRSHGSLYNETFLIRRVWETHDGTFLCKKSIYQMSLQYVSRLRNFLSVAEFDRTVYDTIFRE